MELLPLDKLGARETSGGQVDLGVIFPWISAADGYRIWAKVIHCRDQFIQRIPPVWVPMQHAVDPKYCDYWHGTINFQGAGLAEPNSHWGEPGQYVYRYYVESPMGHKIDWVCDPYAREFGVGKLSAFTLGYTPYTWSENEAAWRAPNLRDLIVYELMISEFGGDLEGAKARLEYLKDLGVNCLELMPVSNVTGVIDWGFAPIGYFGVDERFGKRKDIQAFIDAAHQYGLAVILDVVYGHTSPSFGYAYLYDQLGFHDNPFMGPFGADLAFGASTDFNRALTRDYFFTANYHWLDCYHIDGFRYDCVPNYWDGALGNGYANLTFETHQLAQAKINAGRWQRFNDNGKASLIQCAEQLEDPVGVLHKSYSNCTWQNGTYGVAVSCAYGHRYDLASLGLDMGLFGYPDTVTMNNQDFDKTAFQYTENHDHERFVCHYGLIQRDNEPLLSEGNRDYWYKCQPYLIGLLTGKGIPMLWQGQEICENYFVPPQGYGRVMLLRPVRWEYFYDEAGKSTIGLVRKLIRLRKENPQFSRGTYYFYNHYDNYSSRNVLLFSREHAGRFSLVALNFGDSGQTVYFPFPFGGRYTEELHGQDNLTDVTAGTARPIHVPSNYGRIWTHQP